MADHVFERFRTEEAKDAYRLLVREAEAKGLHFHYPNSAALSVEFVERTGEKPFSAIANNKHLLFYLRRPILDRLPGIFRLASERFSSVEPNHLGEYRKRIHNSAEMTEMLEWLREVGAWDSVRGFPQPALRKDGRLPAAVLDAVTAEHLLLSARLLAAGFDDHDFSDSTTYEIAFEGKRIKPKALYGVAATRALGFRVRPRHFSGGIGTQCFRTIERAGYRIIPAGALLPTRRPRLTDEDKRWAEGNRKLVTHLVRERADGISQAKKDQFRAAHGRLFCEDCGLDPVQHFHHEDGEAAIEAHHHQVTLAEMEEPHETALDELKLLCANCHRVEHRRMKREAKEQLAPAGD